MGFVWFQKSKTAVSSWNVAASQKRWLPRVQIVLTFWFILAEKVIGEFFLAMSTTLEPLVSCGHWVWAMPLPPSSADDQLKIWSTANFCAWENNLCQLFGRKLRKDRKAQMGVTAQCSDVDLLNSKSKSGSRIQGFFRLARSGSRVYSRSRSTVRTDPPLTPESLSHQ